MLPSIVSKSLTAPSANCIAQGQSVAAGANAVLNGGSVVVVGNGVFGADVTQAVLDTQRRIAIVSSGNDGSNSATITGRRGTGQPINEILSLTNAGTAVSVLDYQNVSIVNFTSATAGTITIGTCGTGSTDWIVPNYHLTPFQVQEDIEVAGTVTFNFETTNDRNYFDPQRGLGATTPQPRVTAVVTGGTITQQATLTAPVTGMRFTITAGAGTVSAQGVQSGIANF